MVFCDAALAQEAVKNAKADMLEKDWAYWLKYVYGYQGYEPSLYDDYDHAADYGDGDEVEYDLDGQSHSDEDDGDDY